MNKYVIQMCPQHWTHKWITVGNPFDTLEEARAAFDALPIKAGYRIAEAYTVARYKPVQSEGGNQP